jgi:hypothetical protein
MIRSRNAELRELESLRLPRVPAFLAGVAVLDAAVVVLTLLRVVSP